MSEGKINEVIQKDRNRTFDKERLELIEEINEDINTLEQIEQRLNAMSGNEVKLRELFNKRYKLIADFIPLGLIILLAIGSMMEFKAINFLKESSDGVFLISKLVNIGLIVIIIVSIGFLFIIFVKVLAMLNWWSEKQQRDDLLNITQEKKEVLKESKKLFEEHDMKQISKDMRKYRLWREYEFFFIKKDEETKIKIEMLKG